MSYLHQLFCEIIPDIKSIRKKGRPRGKLNTGKELPSRCKKLTLDTKMIKENNLLQITKRSSSKKNTAVCKKLNLDYDIVKEETLTEKLFCGK